MWFCIGCGHEKFNKEDMAAELNKLPRVPGYERYQFKSKRVVGAPECPKCGGQIQPQKLPPKGPENVFGYQVYWYCLNPDCDFERFSLKSEKEDRERLKDGIPKKSK